MSASLVPQPSPLVRAVSETSAAQRPLDVSGLGLIWDPWHCPEPYLPYLARAFGVRVWDDAWALAKRRSVVARAKSHGRASGSRWLAGEYLGLRDGQMLGYEAMPIGFVAAGPLDPSAWDAMMDAHPVIRVTFARQTGELGAEIVADMTAADDAAACADTSWQLWGRRAVLRRGGITTDLPVGTVRDLSGVHSGEAMSLPGQAGAGLAADASALDDGAVDAVTTAALLYGWRPVVTADLAGLPADGCLAGLRMRDIRIRRETETGSGYGRYHADCDAADAGVAGDHDGGELLADVVRLIDPDLAVPALDAVSATDMSRVAMPPHHVEVMARLDHRLDDLSCISGQAVTDLAVAGAADDGGVWLAVDAADAARALADKMTITFETTRAITLGEGRPLGRPMPLDARQQAGRMMQ